MYHQKWNKIQEYYELVSARSISDLFKDSRRFEDFSLEANDIVLDFSKTNLDQRAKNLMLNLIESSNVRLELP